MGGDLDTGETSNCQIWSVVSNVPIAMMACLLSIAPPQPFEVFPEVPGVRRAVIWKNEFLFATALFATLPATVLAMRALWMYGLLMPREPSQTERMRPRSVITPGHEQLVVVSPFKHQYRPHSIRATTPPRILLLTAIFITCFPRSVAGQLPGASSGDDFANNMFTDLGPILSLFGEQVTKQFLAQSTTWEDHIIFAMAPIGIITAIVSAIRLGGPLLLRAIIGRARENKALAEAELTTSTSRDVCELWNGLTVIRTMGSPHILQLIYFPDSKGDSPSWGCYELNGDSIANGIFTCPTRSSSAHRYSKMLPPPLARLLGLCEPLLRYLRRVVTWGTHVGNIPRPASATLNHTKVTNTTKPVPNIFLNLQPENNLHRRLELLFFVIFSTALQLGVLVFMGFATYHPTLMWQKDDDQSVHGHAFPVTAAGTVLLVFGMWLCSVVVDGSTFEETWEFSDKGYILWLQQGGNVNDQNFPSYAIFAKDARKSIMTSTLGNGRYQMGAKAAGATPPDLMDNAEEASRCANTASPVVSDHRISSDKALKTTEASAIAPSQVRQLIVVIATAISVTGFLAQLTGLRSLHWSAPIAQLVATVIMLAVRAFIRRNLAFSPLVSPTPQNYELDWLSLNLSKYSDRLWSDSTSQRPTSPGSCLRWTWTKNSRNPDLRNAWEDPVKFDTNYYRGLPGWSLRTGLDLFNTDKKSGEQKSGPGAVAPSCLKQFAGCLNTSADTLARNTFTPQSVMKRRERLGSLSGWGCAATKPAVAISKAIEVVMNNLFPIDSQDLDSEISVESPVTEWEWTLQGFIRNIAGNVEQGAIRVKVSHKGNKGWRVETTELEAVLSLWLYAIHQADKNTDASDLSESHDRLRHEHTSSKRSTFRLLGPKDEPYVRNLYAYIGPGLETALQEVKIKAMHTTFTHQPNTRGIPSTMKYEMSELNLDNFQADPKEHHSGTAEDLERKEGKSDQIFHQKRSSPTTSCNPKKNVMESRMSKAPKTDSVSDREERTPTSPTMAGSHIQTSGTKLLDRKAIRSDITNTYLCERSHVPATSGSQQPQLNNNTGISAENTIARHRLVGFPYPPSITRPPNEDDTFLALHSESNTSYLLVQDMFCSFIWAVSEQIERIKGETSVEKMPTSSGEWRHLKLHNTVLAKIAREVHSASADFFSSIDSVYLCLLPPLHWNGKLPIPECVVEQFVGLANSKEAEVEFQQAAEIYSWLAATCAGLTSRPDDPFRIKVASHVMEFERAVNCYAEMFSHEALLLPEVQDTISACRREIQKWHNGFVTEEFSHELDRLMEIQRYNERVLRTDLPVYRFRGFANATPVHMMALRHDVDPIDLNDADMASTRDILGLTPLHYMVLWTLGRPEDLDWTRRSPNCCYINNQPRDVDFTVPDILGWYPVHYAALYNSDRLVQYILKSDARRGKIVSATCRNSSGYTALHYAKDHQVALTLLRCGAIEDAKARDGRTPLHLAARLGKVSVCSVLLREGADVHMADNLGMTPLHHAAHSGAVDVVSLFLQHGAEVSASDLYGRSPLHLALLGDHCEQRLLELLSAGDNVMSLADCHGFTPAQYATIAVTSYADMIKFLGVFAHFSTHRTEQSIMRNDNLLKENVFQLAIRHACNLVAWLETVFHGVLFDKWSLSKLRLNTELLLLTAAEHGNHGAVWALLQRTNQVSNLEGQHPFPDVATALRRAAGGGHYRTVRILIHALKYSITQFHVDTSGPNGVTALDLAAYRGHWDIVDELIMAGASPQRTLYMALLGIALSTKSKTGLFGDIQLVTIRKHIPLSRTNAEGIALVLATRHFFPFSLEETGLEREPEADTWFQIFHTLVEKFGASCRSSDLESGLTALHAAASSGNERIVDLILAAIDATDGLNDETFGINAAAHPEGETPLHYACRGGHHTVVESLLRSGADITAKSRCGRLPFNEIFMTETGSSIASLLLRQHDAVGNMNMPELTRHIWVDILHNRCMCGGRKSPGLALGVDSYCNKPGHAKTLQTVLKVPSPIREGLVGMLSDSDWGYHLLSTLVIGSSTHMLRTILEEVYKKFNIEIPNTRPAEINTQSHHYQYKATLLHVATRPRDANAEVVKILLEYLPQKALMCLDEEASTPLTSPVVKGRFDIVQHLVDHDTTSGEFLDMSGCSHFGGTALHLAAVTCKYPNQDWEKTVRILAQCPNLRLDARDNFGYTALHHIVRNCSAMTAKFVMNRIDWHAQQDLFTVSDVHQQNGEQSNQENQLEPVYPQSPRVYRATLLHEAIANTSSGDGCIQITNAILSLPGVQVNLRARTREPFGRTETDWWTVLHMAVGKHYRGPELIEMLLNAGADVKAVDSENCIPLHIAANYGHVEAVQLLLSAYPEHPVKYLDGFGRTPLHHAVFGKRPEIIDLLVKAGYQADITLEDSERCTPVIHAIWNDEPEILKKLLAWARKSMDVVFDPKSKMHHSMFLHYAAKRTQLDIVETLLNETYFDVNDPDPTGDTVLHAAITGTPYTNRFNRDVPKLAALLLHKFAADATLTCHCEPQPLTVLEHLILKLSKLREGITFCTKQSVLRELFVVMLADYRFCTTLNRQDSDQRRTPLHKIMDCNFTVDVEEYMRMRAKIGDDEELFDPLSVQEPIKDNDSFMKELIELMVERGADVNVQDYLGRTTLHAAVSNNLLEVSRYLLQKHGHIFPASRPAEEHDGSMPLHVAAKLDNIRMCKMLVNEFAHPVDIRDKSGKIPHDYARKPEVLEFLCGKYLSGLTDEAERVEFNTFFQERLRRAHREEEEDEKMGEGTENPKGQGDGETAKDRAGREDGERARDGEDGTVNKLGAEKAKPERDGENAKDKTEVEDGEGVKNDDEGLEEGGEEAEGPS